MYFTMAQKRFGSPYGTEHKVAPSASINVMPLALRRCCVATLEHSLIFGVEFGTLRA
jgi:hypothetical protein